MNTGFALHVIRPPLPLDWSSPRSLLWTTLRNHLLNDPFAIGHYYIELKMPKPNAFGVSHVLTGMSRRNKNRSTFSVIQKQLGLGSFFHLFEGQLDLASKAQKNIDKARGRNRLKSIFIPLGETKAATLFAELSEWIRVGGHLYYGGGQDIPTCQGSGCADFGAHFFSQAYAHALPESWIRRVFAPKDLVGNAKSGKRVGLLQILKTGLSWASAEAGAEYKTPDMELTWEWLEANYPGQNRIELMPLDLSDPPKFSPAASRASLSHAEQSLQWKRVSL